MTDTFERYSVVNDQNKFWVDADRLVAFVKKFGEICTGTPFEGSRCVYTGEFVPRHRDKQTKYVVEPAWYRFELIPTESYYTPIPGHTFCGYTEKESDGWLIYSIGKFEFNQEIVSQLDPLRCDVCGHRRNRKRLFVLKENETGNFIIVGGSCAKKFKGVDLEAEITKVLAPIETFISEYLDDYSGEGSDSSSVSPFEFLIARAEVLIEKWGYVSKREAEIQLTEPTSALLSLGETRGNRVDPVREEIWKLYYEKSEQIIARAKQLKETGYSELIEYFDGQGFSEFIHNCIVTIKSERYSFGIVAYIGSVAGRIAETLKKNRNNQNDKPVGFNGVKVGKVADFGWFRVVAAKWRSSHYGDTLGFCCLNDKNEKVWFQSIDGSVIVRAYEGACEKLGINQEVWLDLRGTLTEVKEEISFARRVKAKAVEIRG